MGAGIFNIGRNDPCPCGSGKKFKKCHMGKEDELLAQGMGEITKQMSDSIVNLPEVSYGRAREFADALNLKGLVGRELGIRFVDLREYSRLRLFGGTHKMTELKRGGGVIINMLKTQLSDPHNIYMAISPDIDDSTLAHQIAHILDYLGGSKIPPGTFQAISLEVDVPVDHLEHCEEFGYWLDYIKKRFEITLDADDTIIHYLYSHGLLIPARDIIAANRAILKAKSDKIFTFLSEHSEEIDSLIRSLPGYMGKRIP